MHPKKQKNPIEWTIGSPEDLGAMVKQLRKEAGLTLQQAANFSGVNYRFFVELEHGKHTLRLSHIMKVLKAFGIVLTTRRQGLQ